jgi:peptide methionine sulfoxide reductase MsrA
MGDHTEAVQIDYDPGTISYRQLLDIFWDSHDPLSRSFGRQYMNAVFYVTEEQRVAAERSKSEWEKENGGTVQTAITPVRSFTMAEDYHQKYMLKSARRLHREMASVYPHHPDYVNSTAVSRLNGYAGGYGTLEQFLLEADRLGMTPEGKKEVTRILRR